MAHKQSAAKQWETIIQRTIDDSPFPLERCVRYTIVEHDRDVTYADTPCLREDTAGVKEWMMEQADSAFKTLAKQYRAVTADYGEEETAEGLLALLMSKRSLGYARWEVQLMGALVLQVNEFKDSDHLSELFAYALDHNFNMAYTYLILYTWGDGTDNEHAVAVLNMKDTLQHGLV